jgi:ATP synthase protein I
MKISQHNNNTEDLSRAVRLREARHQRWEEEGERPLWRNLSMVGALGWLVVVPMLIGVFAGRWLDQTFDSGVLFTGALLFVGVVVGGYLAWQRITRE